MDGLNSQDVKKAFKVILKRFWRFGDVELVSRVANEFAHYFEEVN
jgi:hypothetical protein